LNHNEAKRIAKIDLILLKDMMIKCIDDYIIVNGSNEINLDKDLYWRISDESIFEVTKDPTNFEIGNLLEELNDLISQYLASRTMSSVSLQSLASILNWLSTK